MNELTLLRLMVLYPTFVYICSWCFLFYLFIYFLYFFVGFFSFWGGGGGVGGVGREACYVHICTSTVKEKHE